jgi:hypothetical protein
MAVTTQEIKMLGCDADGCEVKAPAVDRKLPAKFESGFVDLGELGDTAARWVACRKTHISAAVLAAKAKALAERAAQPDSAQPDDTEPERGDDGDVVKAGSYDDEFDATEVPAYADA